MKKRVLLSSILTIALCLGLIAGSTYALFTNSSDFNITVQAGNVEMFASIADVQLYSVEGNPAGNITDENGNTYSYQSVSPTFTNGGTADFAGSLLTIDKITPGDMVEFDLTGENNSNVAVQYRYVIECIGGYKLMSGLNLYVNGAKHEAVASYTSLWYDLGVGSNIEDIAPVTIALELPVDAGNEYQNLKTDIRVTVEVIQGNAVVDDYIEPIVVEIPVISTPAELQAALANEDVPAVNILDESITTYAIDYPVTDKVIYVNGNDVSFVFTNTVENVVIDGIVADDAGCKVNLDGATGDVTIVNSTFASGTGNFDAAIVPGQNCDIVIDNCTFDGGKYALYNYDPAGALIITNSTFKNFNSWAIQVNNQINNNVVIDGCTFENANSGLIKINSAPTVDPANPFTFTFTNNTVVNSRGHDGKDAQWLWVSALYDITATGNTLDGADWNPGAAQGLGR